MQPLAVGHAAQDEDADAPALERLAPLHPDYLPVFDLRLHAVAGYPHGKVGPGRGLLRVYGLKILAVEELARTCGGRQRVERQDAPGRGVLLLGVEPAGEQYADIVRDEPAALGVEPGGEAARGREGAHDVPDPVDAAQRQKLRRVRHGHVLFPLADARGPYLHALGRQQLRDPRLGQASLTPEFSKYRSKRFFHPHHLLTRHIIAKLSANSKSRRVT